MGALQNKIKFLENKLLRVAEMQYQNLMDMSVCTSTVPVCGSIADCIAMYNDNVI